MTKKICCKNIDKSFGETVVFQNATFEFQTGINCLFGQSGIGKTTLLRLISGLETPDAGKIIGVEGQQISYLFQEDRLLPWSTTKANIAILHGEQEAQTWLERFQLESAAALYPKQLSGGMKRRVALARALAGKYDILLLDEPSKGLDDALKETFYDWLEKAVENKICILVTHDQKEAERLSEFFVQI